MSWREKAFFGLHFDFHADERDTDIGKDLTAEHVYEMLNRVHPDYVQCDCKGHMGYASWPTKTGVPAPGIVSDPLSVWNEAAKRLGIPIIMHYSGVWDKAAIARHPEYGRINGFAECKDSWIPKETNALGRDANMVCPLSGYTKEYMIPQMIELIDRYGVDGFWVDGECWAAEPCYCGACTADFKDKTGAASVPRARGEQHWEEWLAYSRENFVRHVREYADAVHERDPDCTVCSNWMYTFRHPDRITAPVDYLSGDFSCTWSVQAAETEARYVSNLGLPWELMAWGFTTYTGTVDECVFKSVPALCQEAAVVLVCGGSSLVYDQPDRSGHIIPWHMDRLAAVKRFCDGRKPWWQDSVSIPQAAILHGREAYYHDNIPLFNPGRSARAIEGALALTLDSGLHADLLGQEDLAGTMDRYPLVILPAAAFLPEEISAGLQAYVENGGRLIIAGLEEKKDFDGLLGVEDAGGFWDSKKETVQPNLMCGDGCVVAMGKWRHVTAKDCETVTAMISGRDTDSGMRGRHYPAIVTRRVGKGRIAGIFGPLCDSYGATRYPYYRRLFQSALDALDLSGMCRVDAPSFLHMSLRSQSGKTLIHLINTGSATPNTPGNAYIEDVPRAGPITVTMPLGKKPAAVTLEPGGNPVAWEFHGNTLHAAIDSAGIYDILAIE